MAGRMLYIRALSPIHSGTGQSTGVIDLPVAREKITDWPYLPGSSLKGVLRDASDPGVAYDRQNLHPFYLAFGPQTDNASDRAGALTFCDGHLLCLPIRSFFGTFAWISCPLALARWRDDAVAAETPIDVPDAPAPGDSEILLARPGTLTGGGDTVYLEDLDLAARLPRGDDDPVARIAAAIAANLFPEEPAADARGADGTWRQRFVNRFGVVADDVFTTLTTVGTEVAARIVLQDDSKTVANLWYEEAVPAQTIFAAPVLLESRLANGVDLWSVVTPHLGRPLQIGGHASVGRGLAWFRL